MKKLLFLSIILLAIQKVHALPMNDYREYRTTNVLGGQWDNFVVSTGATKLWMVQVASGSANYSSFTFKSGTATSVIQSTSPAYDTSTSGRQYFINKTLPEGFMFSSSGTAVLQIDWDWLYTIPKGQEGKGKY